MKTLPRFSTSLMALCAGGLMVLAFAPFQGFPFAIIALTVLLFSIENLSPRNALLCGWLFGMGFFGGGVYWIFISLHEYGHLPALAGALLTVLFIALLAIFPALSAYFLNSRFSTGENIRLLLAFPVIWTLLEWIRSFLLTGFPWLTVGYSQILSPLRGYAPLFGVLGVSFATVLSSGALYKIVKSFQHKTYRQALLPFLGLILLWGGGFGLTFITWTHPEGTPVNVSLIQGNIPESLKWSQNMVGPTLDRYTKLSQPNWGNQLVIWPESAIPDFLDNQFDFLEKIDTLAKQHDTTFITGIPVRVLGNQSYYNTAIALGKGKGAYFKHRLVPFGEYIPFKAVFKNAFDLLQVPFPNFIPDTKPVSPLHAGPLNILTFICYETAFPELVRFRDETIDVLLTLSNDAWFGRSSAQSQHLEMAAMRALETGRPMLFVSNDGPTAIINAKGQVTSIAPAHVEFALNGLVHPMRGKTPWLTFGMDPLLILSVVFLVIARRRKI